MSGVSFKTPSQGGRDNHQPGTWRSTRDRPPAATEQDLSHIGSSFQTCGPPQPALQGFVGCETALHAAIRNRSGELEELIGGGARVDAVDRDDNTALHLAANQGDTHVVQLLLENRAPTDVLNRVLQTPLHNAITAPEGGAAAAAVLLRFGANPNLPGGGAPLCDTPLHAAVRLCDRDKVALLLRHGADISARNAGQDTPLTVAVDKGHLRIVELLLRHSPHAAAVLTHQDDLCSRAARLGHSDIASLMTPRCDPYSARDDGMSNGPGSFFWMISLDVRR
jgi:ankyrin repeat protein